jgi:hypothetical protein
LCADNCSGGMVESGYSYEGLPDPNSYYSDTASGPDFFRLEQQQTQQQNLQQQTLQHPPQQPLEGLQTPSTRAKRVVHEVIV